MIGFGSVAGILAKRFPESGGMFFYPEKVFGKPLLGGISALFYWFGCIAGISFSCIYIGIYLNQLIPLSETGLVLVDLLALALAFVLVFSDFQILSGVNAILTSALIVGIVIVCTILRVDSGAGIHLGLFKNWIDFNSVWPQIPTAILAFGAIVAPAFLSSKIGSKKVTQILLISGGITTIIYVFIISTMTAIIPNSDWASHPNLAMSPFDLAIQKAGSANWLSSLVTILAVLALFTTILILLRLASQALNSAAQAQTLPKTLASDKVSTAVCTIIVGLIVSFYPSISTIVQSGALLTVAFDIIICFAGFKVASGKTKILPILIMAALVGCYIPTIGSSDWLLWAVFGGFSLLSFLVVYFSIKFYKTLRKVYDHQI
jgi:amino acid transporter